MFLPLYFQNAVFQDADAQHGARRYRLVVDESLALGVLGEHGRGACEHWGLKPGDAEIVSASMGERPHTLLPNLL